MSPACPKPSNAGSQKRKDEKSGLIEYRSSQALLARLRDNSLCAICYFRDGKRVPYTDVHHVYSRGRRAGDWREHYTNLLCVCRACHPLPIQTPGASACLAWVESILAQANQTPINKDFKCAKPTGD